MSRLESHYDVVSPKVKTNGKERMEGELLILEVQIVVVMVIVAEVVAVRGGSGQVGGR